MVGTYSYAIGPNINDKYDTQSSRILTTAGYSVSGSTSITGIANTAGLVITTPISGIGIPAAATITAIPSATSLTISSVGGATASAIGTQNGTLFDNQRHRHRHDEYQRPVRRRTGDRPRNPCRDNDCGDQ